MWCNDISDSLRKEGIPVTSRTVTLNLPEHLYSRAERAAKRLDQPLAEVLLKAVDTALPSEADLPVELINSLDALMFMNDAALWEAARNTLKPEQSVRLEKLISESKERLLSAEEKQELDSLIGEYQRVLLVRAKSAVLLKTRGYNVAELTAILPIAA